MSSISIQYKKGMNYPQFIKEIKSKYDLNGKQYNLIEGQNQRFKELTDRESTVTSICGALLPTVTLVMMCVSFFTLSRCQLQPLSYDFGATALIFGTGGAAYLYFRHRTIKEMKKIEVSKEDYDKIMKDLSMATPKSQKKTASAGGSEAANTLFEIAGRVCELLSSAAIFSLII